MATIQKRQETLAKPTVTRNAFDKEIPPMREIVSDYLAGTVIRQMMDSVICSIGVNPKVSHNVVDNCLALARSGLPMEEYEQRANSVMGLVGINEMLQEKLLERSRRVYDQIKDYLIPGTVLDLGCGDGMVGKLISENSRYKVTLADVYKDPKIDSLGLPFRQFAQNDSIPAESGSFNNTLAITVYHHSNDPVRLLRESRRVTQEGCRVIMIESIHGVRGKELSKQERDRIRNFINLNSERQRLVNIFFDHLYNRVIHFSEDPATKVNVPFNFNTPEEWNRLARKEGLEKEMNTVHLGIDQEIVPEYHTLHIFRIV
jgi:SAM-dependent methyltransferase